MKIGLTFFPVRHEWLLPVAQRADMLGYESLWIPEHLAIPAQIDSQYPYNPSLSPPLPTTPLYDPIVTLAFLGAQTRKIKLGTGIYVLPLRHPIITAKIVATLDVLTKGRVLLGVGAGWLKEEFDAVDVPWQSRGSRMEESIQIMRRLWSESLIEHEGKSYRFNELGFEPKPTAPIPILVGGESPAALKRAANYGDGWLGMYHSPESAALRVEELKLLRDSDARPLEISVGQDRVPSLDEILRFRDAGVDRLVIIGKLLWEGGKTLESKLDGLNRFAENILAKVSG